MPVMRVSYTFYIHSTFHLCNSFIRVIRDFNIRGMTTNCSTSSVTEQFPNFANFFGHLSEKKKRTKVLWQ